MTRIPLKEQRALKRKHAINNIFPSAIIFLIGLIPGFLAIICSGAAVTAAGQKEFYTMLLTVAGAGALGYAAFFFFRLGIEGFINSTEYYYESELSRKYGRYIEAEVTEVSIEQREEFSGPKNNRKVCEIFTDLYISTDYDGKTRTVMHEFKDDDGRLAERLKPGMTVSMRVVPGMPETLRIAPRRLVRQLEALQ